MKPGDRVRCIDPSGQTGLIKDKVYIISIIRVSRLRPENRTQEYFSWRFVPVNNYKNKPDRDNPNV